MKYVASHTTPTTTATSDESAAPATPSGGLITQPKIRNGASSMLRMTVVVATIIPGLKLPVPRSAAPMATMTNCKAIAGMNQFRYCSACTAVRASAASVVEYA